ncbi:hypothetical protein JTE90_011933 [Oedothorax gibbosus]|uniref:Uncharacterized protein n=1 Tax=Oedothorax gibbosus TaxID=931172 RepID=A0AAV6V0G1_9ARAC|nr:hypothetical protein JTE90_011933 [Oedothorax gibbosus]
MSRASFKDSTDLDIQNKIKINLGDNDLAFEDGIWKGEISTDSIEPYLKENEKLREENNLLKIKVEVLLNMLAEFMASKENV